jgi:hypothetical protein
MTGEVSRLLEKAVGVYRSLGKARYYDGELSLDNLGFAVSDGQARVVLMDYGAVVDARCCQPAILRQWLRCIRDDFSKSFQVSKLRRYAKGNPRTQRAVDNYISQCLVLVNQWSLQP